METQKTEPDKLTMLHKDTTNIRPNSSHDNCFTEGSKEVNILGNLIHDTGFFLSFPMAYNLQVDSNIKLSTILVSKRSHDVSIIISCIRKSQNIYVSIIISDKTAIAY